MDGGRHAVSAGSLPLRTTRGTNEEEPLVAFGLTALVLVAATRGRLGYARPGGEARAPSAATGGAEPVLA